MTGFLRLAVCTFAGFVVLCDGMSRIAMGFTFGWGPELEAILLKMHHKFSIPGPEV